MSTNVPGNRRCQVVGPGNRYPRQQPTPFIKAEVARATVGLDILISFKNLDSERNTPLLTHQLPFQASISNVHRQCIDLYQFRSSTLHVTLHIGNRLHAATIAFVSNEPYVTGIKSSSRSEDGRYAASIFVYRAITCHLFTVRDQPRETLFAQARARSRAHCAHLQAIAWKL